MNAIRQDWFSNIKNGVLAGLEAVMIMVSIGTFSGTL
jgi:hypothetical protein